MFMHLEGTSPNPPLPSRVPPDRYSESFSEQGMIPRNRATGRWSQNRTGSQSPSLIARKQQWSQFCIHVYYRTCVVILQQCYWSTWGKWSWISLRPTSGYYQSDQEGNMVLQIMCVTDYVFSDSCSCSPWLCFVPSVFLFFFTAATTFSVFVFRTRSMDRTLLLCLCLYLDVKYKRAFGVMKKKISLGKKKNCALRQKQIKADIMCDHVKRPTGEHGPRGCWAGELEPLFQQMVALNEGARRRGSDLLQTADGSPPLCRPTSAIHLSRQAGRQGRKQKKYKS